jgi:hypothetical protein
VTDVAELIRNHFRTAFNLPDEAIERLTETSRTALADGLASLRGALETSDVEEGARWAHSVKGTLLNAGLARMAEDVGAIERALFHSDVWAAGQRLDTLENGVSAFLNGH